MADYQWSKERTQLENTTRAYKETSTRLQELEKEYNIITSSGSIVYVGKEDLLNDLMTHYPDVSTKAIITINSMKSLLTNNVLQIYDASSKWSEFGITYANQPSTGNLLKEIDLNTINAVIS